MRTAILALTISLLALPQAEAGDYHLCTATDPCGPPATGSASGSTLCTPGTPCGTPAAGPGSDPSSTGASPPATYPASPGAPPAGTSTAYPPPANASAQDFAGNWEVHVNDGSVFPMTLVPYGNKVGGNYDPYNRVGTIIDGKVKNNTLRFKWITVGSIKATGEGKFHLDDAANLSGTWSMGIFNGTWVAYRH